MPPMLSETCAAVTTTAISRPIVSTNAKVLRPDLFSATSKPLIAAPTVDAPCTLRASIADPDGSGSRSSDTRTILRKRPTIFSQVPSRLHRMRTNSQAKTAKPSPSTASSHYLTHIPQHDPQNPTPPPAQTNQTASQKDQTATNRIQMSSSNASFCPAYSHSAYLYVRRTACHSHRGDAPSLQHQLSECRARIPSPRVTPLRVRPLRPPRQCSEAQGPAHRGSVGSRYGTR